RGLAPHQGPPRVGGIVASATYTSRPGAESVVVHSAVHRSYARLDPREFELLALMDGRDSVKELVVAYYQRYGVLALGRVAGLVRLLREQHFLVEGSVDAYARLTARLSDGGLLAGAGQLSTSAVDTIFGAAYRVWGDVSFP